MINTTRSLWEYLEKQDTKIAKKVLNALNYDILSVYEDRGIYWLEKTCSWVTIPKYVADYIKRWEKRRDISYLYDNPLNQ